MINLLEYNDRIKTKSLTFLIALTFLFLFSGSVFGEEPEVKKKFYDIWELWIMSKKLVRARMRVV